MPPKATKPTSDELLAQFDNLDVNQPSEKPKSAAPDNAKAGHEDILAELDNLATQRPSSGPGTPRLSSDRAARPATRSPRPSATIDRPNDDKTSARQSAETGRTSRTGDKQEQPKTELKTTAPEESQGGGWWGGIFATANAAMKQAEAAVKEIQNNEEAQRWAQQVKGNVGALKDFGMLLPESYIWTILLT